MKLKKGKLGVLVLLFLSILLSCCFFNLNPRILTVKAEGTASIVDEFGVQSIEPYLVEYPNAYVYVTSFGNYTFKKPLNYLMNYTYRDGTCLVKYSMFWLNTTGWLAPLNPIVLVSNDTMFKFQVDAYYLLKKRAVLTVEVVFFKDVKPKISVEMVKTADWIQGDFEIVWWILSPNTYLKLNATHTFDLRGHGSISIVKTNVDHVELGNTVNPTDWKVWSLSTWEDYGNCTVYGGNYTLLGKSGTWLYVKFNTNDYLIDPSQVAYVYYSVSMPYLRRNFWANGFFRQFYLDIWNYDFRYKGSVDGVTWNNQTTIAGAVADEYVYEYDASVWLENDTFVHLVYIDLNDTAPAGQRYTVSYQTATLGVGSISLGTRRTVCTLVDERSRPTVCLDSNGYPWVGYSVGDNAFYVQKATVKDGSSWGAGTQLFDASYSGAGVIVPLTSGKMYVCWRPFWPTGLPASGRLFNSTGWESSKTICSLPNSGEYERFSVVVKSNFDIVFYNDQLNYYATLNNGTHAYTYDYSSDSWSYTKWVSSEGMVGCVTINKITDDMWFFYTRTHAGSYVVGDGVYYRKYINSTNTWGSEVTVDSTITSLCDLHGFYKQSSNHLGIAYVVSNYLYFISVAEPPITKTIALSPIFYSSAKRLWASVSGRIYGVVPIFAATERLGVFSRKIPQLLSGIHTIESQYVFERSAQVVTKAFDGCSKIIASYSVKLLALNYISLSFSWTTTAHEFVVWIKQELVAVDNLLKSTPLITFKFQGVFQWASEISHWFKIGYIPGGVGPSPIVTPEEEERIPVPEELPEIPTLLPTITLPEEVVQKVGLAIFVMVAIVLIYGVTGEAEKQKSDKRGKNWEL